MPHLMRPAVAQLHFRLDARCFHPELFDTLASRRVERSDDALQVRILPSGHLLEWTNYETSFTELLIPSSQVLPKTELQILYKCSGSWRGQAQSNDIRYGVNGQVEFMTPEVFRQVHEELAQDGLRRGFIFHFEPAPRLGLTPLSYLTVEAFPHGLAISTFHTFPDELAIIRTQSLIEFPAVR